MIYKLLILFALISSVLIIGNAMDINSDAEKENLVSPNINNTSDQAVFNSWVESERQNIIQEYKTNYCKDIRVQTIKASCDNISCNVDYLISGGPWGNVIFTINGVNTKERYTVFYGTDGKC